MKWSVFVTNVNKGVPFKRQVLREEIKTYITGLILGGEYAPGQRLIETQIARELGVSQAPIREAIRDLERAGVLVTEAYKGTFVRKLSSEDLKNVYIVRAELEGLAIRTAVPLISDREIRELELIIEKMIDATADANINEQISLDVSFHSVLVEASQNSILKQIWENICIPQWTYFGTYRFRDNNSPLEIRHRPILEAVRSRNAEKAVELMRRHFLELSEKLGN